MSFCVGERVSAGSVHEGGLELGARLTRRVISRMMRLLRLLVREAGALVSATHTMACDAELYYCEQKL